MSNKILFTRREIAALIGLSEASVIELCKSGQLRAVKIGRSVRVHVDDFNEFVRRGTANKTVTGKDLHQQWQGKQAQ